MLIKSFLAKFDSTNPKNYFYLGLIFLSFPYLFWFYLGENSYVTVFDNLDHEFVFIKQLLESGNVFGFRLEEKVIGAMNGIPRAFYRSGFNLTILLFYIFSDIYAYIIQHFLVHIIGFAGMFFLLKKYFLKDNNLLILLLSLCWGYLNYFHIVAGISIAGQPILLFAFLNLLHRNIKWYNWAIICLFPFFSFIPLTLPFYIPILVIIGLRHYIYVERKIPFAFFIGLISICFINVIVEFPLVYQKTFSDLVSHRTINSLRSFEIDIIKNPIGVIIYQTIRRSITLGYFDSTKGMQHAGSIKAILVIITYVLSIFIYRKKIIKKTLPIVGLLIGIIIWNFLGTSIIKSLTLISDYSFKAYRSSLLLPFLWFLLLVIILNEINWKNIVHRSLSFILIGALFYYILFDNNNKEPSELIINSTKFFNKKSNQHLPTFKQYYSTDLYNDVKKYIGENEIKKYNFLIVGLYPNVAHYNGIKTLGSFQNNYLLSYKREFKKIIQPELEKNKYNAYVFKNFGHNCMIPFLVEERRSEILKKNNLIAIENLDLNLEQTKKMGGKFVISYLPIKNYHTLSNIKFHRTFENKESFYKLYLYELL